eukprot:1197555-Amphidinium_carterae.1
MHADVLDLLDQFLTLNEAQALESNLGENARQASRELYYLLAYRTSGSAALRVRKAPTGAGFTVWRQWEREYNRLAETHSL